MTDKKKLDEAVTLNVSTTQGEMNSNTTFAAEDVSELVMLLKNAGVQSQMFNGPATLTMDVQEKGGSMNTTIQAPDLRSIMHLLEPEFQDQGDEESIEDKAADALAADQAQDAYNAEHPEVEIAQGEVEAELAPVAEATGSSSLAQVFATVPADAFAQAFGEMVGNLVGAQAAGYGSSSIASWPEDTLNGIHKTTVNKALCDAAEQEVISFLNTLDRDADPFGLMQDLCEFVGNQVGSPEIADEMDGEAQMAFSSWEGDIDNDDDDLGDDMDDETLEDSVQMEPYAGVADRKPVQADTKAVPARSGDNPMKGFKDYFKETAERNFVAPKPAVTAETLMDEFRLDELSNDTKNRYFKKAADDINNHANHAEKMRGIGNDEQADKHDRHIMKRAHGMNRAIAKPGSK